MKKLRLAGIGTKEEANRYLRQRYLPDYNRRFRRRPSQPEDYHRRRPGKQELDAAFRLEQERTVSNDWVVRYECRFLQIERESRQAPAGAKVLVTEGRDGGLQVLYRGRQVRWKEIAAPPSRQPEPAKGRAVELRKKLHGPSTNHPWKAWKPTQTTEAEQVRAL